jgi:predicted RNA-binding protein
VPFAKWVTIDIGSVAAGARTEAKWEVDGDFTLRRILFIEKTGASIRAVEVTLRVDQAGYTEDVVPAYVLDVTNNLNPELNIKLVKGQEVVFGIRNAEAAARNLYAVLELWT